MIYYPSAFVFRWKENLSLQYVLLPQIIMMSISWLKLYQVDEHFIWIRYHCRLGFDIKWSQNQYTIIVKYTLFGERLK